ncbi:hypothetical protein PIROE2DRAFT_43076 [Piromyces sp. E2]|nr:hypothetical protein PIROE2DRAFT_43076 [Piromyces sp. E2]|eukprot:OUM63879.1 hypothetical protein PIROE2DRAFT_43076 [Piromyces sp. E2]
MPIQLPTHWNPKDKCALLELSKGNLRVSYNGTGKTDGDAAAVRANYPMPYQCGLFYFEVTIINKGRNGYIGIGFCTASVDLRKLPGWENNSWGYHGDDGHSFCFSGTGKAYGPTFTTKDTIGCCINFMDMTVFYTKNGVNLGIAFRDIKNDSLYYPAIGLRTPGEVVEANFGQKKFKFDIENYYSDIINNNKSSVGLNELVLQYLVHHGYSETAQTFYNNAFAKGDKAIKQSEENKMEECDVVDFVLKGDIDSAIDLTNRLYPTVLENNDILLFNLRCRKFIEMIRKNEELDMDTEDAIDDDAMDETFSLFAYEHPNNSVLAYLLEPSRREIIANQLNVAILGMYI